MFQKLLELHYFVWYNNKHKIPNFLSTKGNNEDEVPKELVKFLQYVSADQEESEKDFEDEYVKRLQENVANVKEDREKEKDYMLLEEMLSDEREEGILIGKMNAVFELLEELGSVPDDIVSQIEAEKDIDKLSKVLKIAAKSESMEEFVDSYDEIV